jgi:hypothetical protein
MRAAICAISVVMLTAPTFASGGTDSSQTRAAELVKRLGSSETKAFAAAVPDDPSRFVAVLHIPNVQLLVISGNYPVPALLREHLLKGDYQRVYLDLNSSAEREGRFFVEDLGADGLARDRKPNTPFDITWRNGTERTMYNGDWKAQELSQQEYRARFDRDEAQYVQILQLLLAAHAASLTQ